MQHQGPPFRSARPVPPPPPLPSEDGTSTPYSSNASASGSGVKVVHNDYNQHFVDTGERPQNFIRDHEAHLRFVEYPKLDRLIKLKDEVLAAQAHPPLHLNADLKSFNLTDLNATFDVILMDPPWKEYAERQAALGGVGINGFWTLSELMQLRVDQICESHAFCFIWCASQHLDDGRALLQAWGFRRCEDVCWLKTNKSFQASGRRELVAWQAGQEAPIFRSTKEHCLMGVRGGVRRSADTHFIHSNVDTDVIVAEEPTDAQGRPTGSTAKPAEIYDIIERFCLGRRKLELFGLDRNIRNGWVTVGNEISISNYDSERYLSWVSDPSPGPNTVTRNIRDPTVHRGRYVQSTPEIESLRPKSPTRIRPQVA